MTWKDDIKKEDEPTDSVEFMVEQIQDLCDSIKTYCDNRYALENPKMLASSINKLTDILQDIQGY